MNGDTPDQTKIPRSDDQGRSSDRRSPVIGELALRLNYVEKREAIIEKALHELETSYAVSQERLRETQKDRETIKDLETKFQLFTKEADVRAQKQELAFNTLKTQIFTVVGLLGALVTVLEAIRAFKS